MKAAPVLFPRSPCQVVLFHQLIARRLQTKTVSAHLMGPIKTDKFACQGYVGQRTPLAGEYHYKDFEFQDHAQTTAHLIEQQWAAAPAAVRAVAQLSSTGLPLTAVAQLLATLRATEATTAAKDASTSTSSTSQCEHDGGQGGCSSTMSSMNCNSSNSQLVDSALWQQQPEQEQQDNVQSRDIAALQQQLYISSSFSTAGRQQVVEQVPPQAVNSLVAGSASTPLPAEAPAIPVTAAAGAANENEWEIFYRSHPSAKFFKERRYLLLEFPCLAPPAVVQHVIEIGAGCGSSILPVLRAQPQARATVCDVSPTCLQQLSGALQLLGLGPERCRSFVADGTDPMLGVQLQGCNADVALIMFTLSAVVPEGMLVMMQNAAAALRPGGLLCIRDHALYDMVQLRIPAEQAIGRHLYKRGDGTLAYFYTVQDLSGLAVAAGMEVVECEYVCVVNTNRKTGLQLRRTFVHGVFRKPLD